MITERILITVRTYPTLSKKYTETVCTGGINDQGQWRRLYPVSLRMLSEEKQYRTFDVVSVRVEELTSDGRPESRRPDVNSIQIESHLNDWNARSDWVMPTVCSSMKELVDSGRTLAPVAVSDVLEFIAEPTASEWSSEQLEMLNQLSLFDGPNPLEKIPFDFRLRWRDGNGDEHNSKFIAWEAYQTWRNFRKRYENPTEEMRRVWIEDRCSSKNVVSFFMGNFAQHPQHFGVCGMFTPPRKVYDSGTLW